MPTIMEKNALKHEFRAPTQIIEKELELRKEELEKVVVAPHLPLTVSNVPLLGTWVNCDHATRSLVRVVIAASGNEITVHTFGACSPNPCDWGAVPGRIYADSVCTTPGVAFTATYHQGFVETLMVGRLFEGALFIETFEHFIDNSGRADYYSLNIMNK